MTGFMIGFTYVLYVYNDRLKIFVVPFFIFYHFCFVYGFTYLFSPAYILLLINSPAIDTPCFMNPPKYVNAVLSNFPVVFIAYFILSRLSTAYFYIFGQCNSILFFIFSFVIAVG